MKIVISSALALVLMYGSSSTAYADNSPRARMLIPESDLRPTFAEKPTEQLVHVPRFWIDATLVTNADFLAFVRRHAPWRKGRVAPLFADERYLSHWRKPLAFGPKAMANQPVRFVSWFTANAYCEWRGGRLPRWYEWELLGVASDTHYDARQDSVWEQHILSWYAQTGQVSVTEVMHGKPNIYGVYDIHGLLWEWVEDFNGLLVGEDSREGGNRDNRFCGAGAAAAKDKSSYAMFMRTAFLSSLQARYTMGTLGFRCAYDANPTSKGEKP